VKKLLIAGAALIGLLIVVVLGLGLFLDANQFRPKLEIALSNALGRRVTINNIRIAVFSGGIAVEGLAIADDPAFGREPFVTANSMTVGVDLMPLILSRSLRVESFRLDQPRVVLRRSPSGSWNFSSLSTSASGSGQGTTAAISVLVQRLQVTGGRIVVGQAGRSGDDRVYDAVSVEVTDLSFTTPFPFRVTAKTPGGGTVSLDGQAGPLNTKDAAETPFHATLDVKQLDVASTGFVDPASGVGGLIDFAGALTSDGVRMNTKGTVKATKVRLLPGSAAAGVPVVIEYESTYDSKTERGTLKRGDVHVGRAVAHLTGDYTASGKTPALRMKLAGEKMPATELEAALPAVGVTLPAGASLTQGTVDTDLTIAGPVDRLVIAGSLAMANGTLAGFDLGAKLGALAAFAGLPSGRDTAIEMLSATLRVAPEGIHADALNVVAPAIGTLTGSGSIAPMGAMDFRMLAKVRAGAPGALPGGVGRVVSLGQSNGIPFRVEGTTSAPVFRPDVGALADSVKTSVVDAAKDPENVKKAIDALGGLFGRKKQ
jgi:AsmA protein